MYLCKVQHLMSDYTPVSFLSSFLQKCQGSWFTGVDSMLSMADWLMDLSCRVKIHTVPVLALTVTANDVARKFTVTKAKCYYLEYSLSDIHQNTFRLLHTRCLDLVPAGARMELGRQLWADTKQTLCDWRLVLCCRETHKNKLLLKLSSGSQSKRSPSSQQTVPEALRWQYIYRHDRNFTSGSLDMPSGFLKLLPGEWKNQKA